MEQNFHYPFRWNFLRACVAVWYVMESYSQSTIPKITISEQSPRISIEERCVKSCLHGPKVIRTYINDLVIATSELEARASLIYTLSLLRCNEQEGTVPVEMFSQSYN